MLFMMVCVAVSEAHEGITPLQNGVLITGRTPISLIRAEWT